MLSCKDANILGIPKKGIHRFRLGGIAIVDFILTFIIAVGLAYIPSSPPLTIWLIFLILLAMMIHGGFCTQTSVNIWLNSGYNIWIFSSYLIISIIILIILKYLTPKTK